MDSVSSYNSFSWPQTSDSANVLPPQNLSSPLKRKRPPNSDKESQVAMAIFKPKAARSIFPLESSQNYLTDLPVNLKIAVEQIEQALMQHPQSPMYVSFIRTLILDISKEEKWTEQRKLAELGIIYYYIVSNKRVSSGYNSMLKMRLVDIEAEILVLKAEHKQLKNKELERLFPSGTISYLLRCFVRMIFTPDGNFNLGGCHAVQQILNTRLAIFLTEEQRLQILQVTTKLIEDPNFLNLFKEPFIVHPELEELILIDMKLPSNEKMDFIYVRWDLLMALFTEISGQYFGEENCYAIAAASKMMREHYGFVLSILIDVLKTGTFHFDDQAFPILPLLESRRKYAVDFQKELFDKEAGNLVAFSVANAVLNPEEKTTQVSQRKLDQKIESHFGTDAAYAKEIFLSHKQNVLQQIFIAILQFHGVNGKSIQRVNSIEEAWRERLFIFVNKAIEHGIKQTPTLTAILEKLNELFCKHFFLIGYLSWNHKIVGNKIVFDFQSQGLPDMPAFNYDSFESIERLFFFKDNGLIPLDSIDGFNQSLIEIAQMVRQIENRPKYQKTIDILINFFKTDVWKKIVAHQIIYKWNALAADLDLAAHIYEKSNSFFLVQAGGSIELIGDWVYKKPFLDSKREIKSAPNIKELFLKICREFKDFSAINGDFSNQQDKKILASTDTHVFNLTPHRFKKYWSDPALINSNVIGPAQKMWNQRPSDQTKSSILKMICDEKTTEKILSKISKGRIGFRRYRKEVLPHLVASKRHKFTEAIEAYLQKIDINDFIKQIKAILAKQNVTLELKEESHLTAYLKKRSEKKGDTLFTPQQLAKFLHKALILSPKNAIFIPKYLLEEEICLLFGFPHSIELGSLNWVGNLVEKPKEDRLLLKYDVDSNNASLFSKRNSTIKILDKDFLEDFLKKTEFYLF